MASGDDPLAAFIEAACVPRDSGHASGTLECAEAILAAHPEVASSDVHAAAILGHVGALYKEGDGYFGIAKDSTALHVAAWRAWHRTVRFLIERGAPIDARDGAGRTALALAVRACVDSYWAYRRSSESVQALLEAGASISGVTVPSGYAEVDALLRRHGGGS